MIPDSGTFEYEAEFTPDSFGDSDIDLYAASQRREDTERLLGHDPKIRFWNERLVLVASGEHNASARNMSVPIGDAVNLSAQPGDRLYVVRTGSGGIGLSLTRQERLVLALGAVTTVPLGTDINIIRRWDFEGRFLPDTWLELSVGSEPLRLRERETIEAEPYHVYLERDWEAGVPGTDECVSVCVTEDPALKVAAMRSAILLANGDLKITKWDGRELFTPA